MSLRYAIMATLLAGPASGYELAKRFDASTGAFWAARPQQIYSELRAMEGLGLVDVTVVRTEGRPDRRDCRLTDTGRASLATWVAEPPAPSSVKDELLVKLAASEVVDVEHILGAVHRWREQRAERLAGLEQLEPAFLRGRTREEYLRSARRVGPYLTLVRGLEFERANLRWADEVISVVSARGRP